MSYIAMSAADGISYLWVFAMIGYLFGFGCLGLWIGGFKKRSTEGMILAIVLGPIGLIITLLLPEGNEKPQTEKPSVSLFGSRSSDGLAWRKTKEAKEWAKKKK